MRYAYRTSRRAGRLGRGLGAAALFAALAACQSVDSLDSLFDGGTRPQQAARAETAPPAEPVVREQRPAGAEATAQTQVRPAEPAPREEAGIVRIQQQSTAPAAGGPASQPAPAATLAPAAPAPAATAQETTAGDGGGEAPAGEQAAEAGPAGEGDDGGRRVAEAPRSGGFGGQITRRFDSLFSSGTTTVAPLDPVGEQEVTGNWLLDEEDGLRTCAISLAPMQSGAAVRAGEGCAGLAASAVRWSIFGSDLLLSAADNTVIARLRRSGASWIGFTLATGIPVVLMRPGAAGDSG